MESRESIPVVIPFVVKRVLGEPRVMMALSLSSTEATTPGGKTEQGETPRKATQREIREETGMRVRLSDIIPVSETPILFRTGAHAGGDLIAASTFIVRHRRRHGNPVARESGKQTQWFWMPIGNLIDYVVYFGGFPPDLILAGNLREKIYECVNQT